jgi:hypothetical protein
MKFACKDEKKSLMLVVSLIKYCKPPWNTYIHFNFFKKEIKVLRFHDGHETIVALHLR